MELVPESACVLYVPLSCNLLGMSHISGGQGCSQAGGHRCGGPHFMGDGCRRPPLSCMKWAWLQESDLCCRRLLKKWFGWVYNYSFKTLNSTITVLVAMHGEGGCFAFGPSTIDPCMGCSEVLECCSNTPPERTLQVKDIQWEVVDHTTSMQCEPRAHVINNYCGFTWSMTDMLLVYQLIVRPS